MILHNYHVVMESFVATCGLLVTLGSDEPSDTPRP